MSHFNKTGLSSFFHGIAQIAYTTRHLHLGALWIPLKLSLLTDISHLFKTKREGVGAAHLGLEWATVPGPPFVWTVFCWDPVVRKALERESPSDRGEVCSWSLLPFDYGELSLVGFTEKASQSCMKSSALMNNIKMMVPSFIHEIQNEKTPPTSCSSPPNFCFLTTIFVSEQILSLQGWRQQ